MAAEKRRRLSQMISGNPRSHQRLSARKGQAALEVSLALVGAMILLLGSLQVFLWVNERLVKRHLSYEATRVAAGSNEPGKLWQEPTTRLKIFKE